MSSERLVREDERELRLVRGIPEGLLDDLVHGRDARAAGEHADVAHALDLALRILPVAAAEVFNTTVGPFREMASPTFKRPKYCDILPPSGKRSILPPSYTLMTRSALPKSARRTSACSSAGSRRHLLPGHPFHSTCPRRRPSGWGRRS